MVFASVSWHVASGVNSHAEFAADENFNFTIARGLRRRLPQLDAVTVQDAGMSGTDDPGILAWAASQQRIILTHDVTTMTAYAYDRVLLGLSMPGVFEISRNVPISLVIEDIVLIAECSLEDEWEGQVRYLPLR